ncbi:uncharacterized protein LOC117581923 [Drosophila guanche]|uniref:Uncharacterized protein n=1 Tax=Drosophila guanche TaxID=7266 RepID=A0A3B0K0M3_DROGU|nr:uncharacterized protein LOC117581923 [Drosophila guanche]SPP79166.1 Hypothetical predicted protein [Drosophila guanche]
MGEPISGRFARCLYNSFLLCTALRAVQQLQPEEHPFAYAACAVGVVVSGLGLLRVIFASGQPNECRRLRDVCHGLLELAPLPLANMDLYMQSTGMLSALTLGHACFVLPLSCDLCCSLFKGRQDCDTADSLRNLTILGNIVSLGFLGIMEGNFFYIRMMLVMFAVRYGGVLMDSMQEEASEDLQLCGTALFFHLLGKALEAK